MNKLLLVLVIAAAAVAIVNAAQGNPFVGAQFYTNPDFVAEVDQTIAKHPELTTQLKKVQQIAAAYWIDTISRIGNVTKVLQGAKDQQTKTGTPALTTFIVYDLPNRDCAAAASNGEISCADSGCAAGLAMYKSKYIDPIVAIFKQFPNQPIVAIIEPDSLGNMATNMDIAKCAQAETAYLQGTAYTISQLSMLSNVYMYLDAAHGGWLGWPNNLQAIAQIFQKVLNSAGGADKIRGFATNTANYQGLGSLTSTADPCKLESQYNMAINEVKYVSMLSQQLSQVGITNKGYIIDTSRNGVPNTRSDCSNWCNINNSGLGMRPVASPSGLGINNIDALFWLKTPGESDGTSDQSAPRYDFHCGSVDSYKPSPQAGLWNDDFFVMLVKNANPPL